MAEEPEKAQDFTVVFPDGKDHLDDPIDAVQEVPVPAADDEARHHHHHHEPTHEELELAAFLNWCASGKPYFDASVTFANWIDAVDNWGEESQPTPPPVE